MIVDFDLSLYGYNFKGVAEIEEGEPDTSVSPGWPPIATILMISINDSKEDAMPIVAPNTIAKLESMILECRE